MGDVLYCVPAVKHLSNKHNSSCDFYIIGEFSGIKPLLKYQDYIRNVAVPSGFEKGTLLPDNYHRLHDSIPKQYSYTYDLGITVYPDRFLADYFCHHYGIEPQALELEYPASLNSTEYVSYDIKARNRYPSLMAKVESTIGIPFIDVGSKNVSTVEVPGIVQNSIGFIGVPSFPLAAASFVNSRKRVALVTPGFQVHHLRSGVNDMVVVMESDSEKYSESICKFLAS